MATNIAITGEIYGKTLTGKVTEGGATVISNLDGSGKILRVGSLLISNTTAAVNADVIAVVRRGGTVGASSIYFDGASYLTLDSNAGLSFSGDFTIEAFVYLLSNAAYGGIIDCRASGGASNYLFCVRNNGYQRLGWLVNSNNDWFQSDTPIFYNRWTHVAVVRSGSTLYFYIDGARDANTATLSGSVPANSSTPRIGALVDTNWNGTPAYLFNGYMEEIRASNTARYSGTSFSVPTSPFANNHVNSMLLLHGDGENNGTTFTDSVLSPHTITRVGGTKTSTAQSVFAGDDKKLVHRVSVPFNSTLSVIERPVYLEEGDRIVCYASTNERLEYVCSYEEIG